MGVNYWGQSLLELAQLGSPTFRIDSQGDECTGEKNVFEGENLTAKNDGGCKAASMMIVY